MGAVWLFVTVAAEAAEERLRDDSGVRHVNLESAENHVRRSRRAGVHFGVEQHAINNVHDTVRKKDIRLHNHGRDVSGSDILAGSVDREGKRFATGGCVILGASQEGRIERSAVNEL